MTAEPNHSAARRVPCPSVRGVEGALIIVCNSGLKIVAAPRAWSWYREVPEGYGE